MCELFAMSSSSEATVNYSLESFSRHGGLTAGNKDGWGICFHNGTEARIIKEPKPASTSPWVQFIANQHVASQCVIAHVRMATRGHPKLENTHPFERELGGRRHVFAHNGTLVDFEKAVPLRAGHYRPIGETDSEHVFCALLERLEGLWLGQEEIPSWETRLDVVAAFAAELQPHGQANFLYTDGDVLFVHADVRRYEVSGRLTEPRPPGLNVRFCERRPSGEGLSVDGLEVKGDNQELVLFASVPLGANGWAPLPQGTVLAVKAGRELARVSA